MTMHNTDPKWRPRSARARPSRSPLIGLALLAGWLTSPRAGVIDDFENGPNWDGVSDDSGILEVEIVDGSLRMSRGAPSSATVSGAWYWHTYVIPEDRSLEFRLDSVSASSDDLATSFWFEVEGAQRSYGIHRSRRVMWIGKVWMPWGVNWFVEEAPIPEVTDPVTLVYSFTRQGDDVAIRAKVVMRDDPEQVVVELPPVIDTPGRDMLADGTLEPAQTASPHYGPSMDVALGLAMLGGNAEPISLVVDNFTCSEDPTPPALHAGLAGDRLRLSWVGAWTVLEADSPAGPWAPALTGTQVRLGLPQKECSLVATGPARFFLLAPGVSRANSFIDGDTGWRTCAATPGTACPRLMRAGNGYRITGSGGANQDFLLLQDDHLLYWQRDRVASIDLAGWDETMVGATFGLLLRVAKEDHIWRGGDGLPEERYEGAVTFRTADDPTESALTISGPGGEVLAQARFPLLDPARKYRLRFSAFGDELDLAILAPTSGEIPLAACHAADDRLPVGMPGLHGSRSTGDVYELTVTDLVFNGTARSGPGPGAP